MMATLTNESARADILSRLKRAEGQLRGVQRMLQEGSPCLDVAQQFSAVRKAPPESSQTRPFRHPAPSRASPVRSVPCGATDPVVVW